MNVITLSAEDQKTLLKFAHSKNRAVRVTRQERNTLKQLGLISYAGLTYRLTGLGFRTFKQLTAE